MVALTPKKSRPTYAKILEAARALPPEEQRRLRDELTKLVGVQLMPPARDEAAIRRGRRLAQKIQAQLAAEESASLDDTMRALRGRSWSS